jgi:hypothetical protein
MRKSLWIEVVEWCVLGAIMLFLVGVLAMRGEITSSDDASVPRYSIGEP